MLRLINIHKDYYVNKKPLHVLKGIDLTFPKQQFVTILGPSGCGKTTLLNLIGGLDKYTSGDLIIEGKSTKQFKDSDWDAYRNHSVGFVFQSYNLIAHLSVLENVEISLTLTGISAQERRQRAINALHEVGLEDEVYKKSNQLSGGQMQRVAIARAIVNNPSIILADEPTGALDTKTSGQVLDILKEVSKTRLVIMVSHNEKLAKAYSDRIIRMVDGKITSDSKPGETEKLAKTVSTERPKGTAMSFSTALKSSYKNILTKKGRTILTSLAGSLGIIGIGLVSAVSNGFQNYIDRMEQETMASYPMAVLAQSIKLDQGFRHQVVDEKYPDIEEIKVYNPSEADQQMIPMEYNIINEEVIEFAKDLKTDGLASSVLINYSNRMRVIYEGPGEDNYGFVNRTDRLSGITPLPTGSFTQMPGDEDYILQFYDLLGGEKAHFPQNENEVVIVIDAYNKLSIQVLEDLGIVERTTAPEVITFNDIIGHEFKALSNDEFFIENDVVNTFPAGVYDLLTRQENKPIRTFKNPRTSELKDRYLDDSIGVKLQITGVLRPKRETRLSLIPAGIAYTNELTDRMQALNTNNEIGKAAINNMALVTAPAMDGGKIDTTELLKGFKFYSPMARSNGEARELIATDFLTEVKNYGARVDDLVITNASLEVIIKTLLSTIFSPAESIAIFPKDAASKKLIKEKFEQYNAKMLVDHGPELGKLYEIKLFDAVEVVTDSLATMIDIISIVLIVFTSISLVVSGFLIGIITYVSVIERTKEIGILRAIGARKKDVSRLFNAETFIIGMLAGLIGVISTYVISIPINLILNYVFPDQGIGQIAFLAPLVGLFLIVFNVSLTVIAGLIPSRIAANKDPVVALRTE